VWLRRPYNPTAYDDDWEDQPAQSAFHKWVLGVLAPALILSYGIWILITREAEFGSYITMTLHGYNAIAFGTAMISAAVFLHCHYFWGNIYNQAWFAVLGKIIAATGFISGLLFLCIHIGILGRS
jgi:hypothetical protein